MEKIKIGTDCSGIEAPIQAIQQLKIPFKHVFSSEIDQFCIKSIKANYDPEIIFGDRDGDFPEGDIRKRKISSVPDIDLYVCGFPCQPFSTAGYREGFKDERGNVFETCYEIIKHKKPSYFILENVKGLLSHDKGETWKIVLKKLKSLKLYNVYWKILNTRDYGIPQNRERLFIVGVKKPLKFSWPKKMKMKPLTAFIDEDNKIEYITTKRQQKILDNLEDGLFIDFAFGTAIERSFINAGSYCSCITANSRIWCVPQRRYATCEELLALQGFKNFEQVVSNTQLKKQIGNSMSVNVLKEIIKNLLN